MATNLQSGAVAVAQMIGSNNNFQQIIQQSNLSLTNFQKTIQNFEITEVPGFQGFWANLLDGVTMLSSIDTLVRQYVITPLKSAILEFSNFGNSYAKMSRQVGIGVHDLSLLGFAAEQSGSSIADLGNGMKFFNRNLAEAGKGNKTALETFEQLGIDFNKLQALDKTDQFLVAAEAIKQLGDEALQTDAAMQLFGKGGTNLLPMFQEGSGGIQDMMQEAELNGIGLSDADAAKAEVLNDSIRRITRSLQGLRTTIVSALAGPVSTVLDQITQLVRGIRGWISENQTIVEWMTILGGISTAALGLVYGWRLVAPIFTGLLRPICTLGTVGIPILSSIFSFFASPPSGAMRNFGTILLRAFSAPWVVLKNWKTIPSLIGGVLSNVATRLKTIGMAILMAFRSPLGTIKNFGTILLRIGYYAITFANPWALAKLAIVGAVGAILYFTGAGTKLMSWLGGFGEKIKATFMSAFGDIVAMIQEGRILDAVKLLWLKIQLFFEEGKLAIINKWDEVAAAISEPFLAIYDTIMSVVQPVFEQLCDASSTAGNAIANAWGSSMGWLCDMLGQWWTWIKEGWDALMNDTGAVVVGTWWSIATGINSAWAWLQTQWNNLLTGMQKTLLYVAKQLINTMTTLMRALDFTGTIQGLVNAANDQLDTMIEGATERANLKNEGIEQARQDRQAYWDDAAVKSLEKSDAAKANAPKTNDRIEGLKLEIAKLKEPVIEPRAKSKEITATAQRIAQSGASSIVSGTFNKADIMGGALAYMASDKDHMENVADNTEKTVDLLKELNGNVRRGGEMVYA